MRARHLSRRNSAGVRIFVYFRVHQSIMYNQKRIEGNTYGEFRYIDSESEEHP